MAWRNYDAFGGTRASSGSWGSAFGFTGQQDDSVDGTVYMRARAYSPAPGRFLQRDSFGSYATAGQTLNRYAYSGNNPATYSDPSGHDFWEDLGKGLGFASQWVGPKAIVRAWEFAKPVGQHLWNYLQTACPLDVLQNALDLLGMLPGIGAPFDLVNAAISAGRGNYGDAALRLLFAIPGLGDLASTAHLARRGLSFADEAAGLLRYADEAPDFLRYTDYVADLRTVCPFRPNSFSGDTLVATPEGEKEIADIQVGDQVLAYNQQTGSTGSYTVTGVLVHLDPAQLQRTIDGELITTTPEHPFYVLLRGWVAAISLREGDQVRQLDGDYGMVWAVAVETAPQQMYNLTVAEAHTFFIGEEGWLVHNDEPCDLDLIKQHLLAAGAPRDLKSDSALQAVADVLERIKRGDTTHPWDNKWGEIFRNDQGQLPKRIGEEYWKEYAVMQGEGDRGRLRIYIGQDPKNPGASREIWYDWSHHGNVRVKNQRPRVRLQNLERWLDGRDS